jgi:hypothetical protein
MISTERGDLVRRKTFLILAAAVILVLGLRFFANEKLTSENSQLEIQLTEYNTANQFSASGSPLAELQNSVDQLSRAALEGQWASASLAVSKIEAAWRGLAPGSTGNLATEEEIETVIQTLRFNVWSQDQEALLATAHQLTVLLSRLAG